MQRLEVSGAVRPIYGSLGVKRLRSYYIMCARDGELMELCLTTYPFQFSHTHNGDDTLTKYINANTEV